MDENKEMVVTVRLNREEVGKLDQLTVGQYSRSQVMRIVLQVSLKKPAQSAAQPLLPVGSGSTSGRRTASPETS